MAAVSGGQPLVGDERLALSADACGAHVVVFGGGPGVKEGEGSASGACGEGVV